MGLACLAGPMFHFLRPVPVQVRTNTHKHIVKHVVVWVWRVECAVQEQTKDQELHPIYFRRMKIISQSNLSPSRGLSHGKKRPASTCKHHFARQTSILLNNTLPTFPSSRISSHPREVGNPMRVPLTGTTATGPNLTQVTNQMKLKCPECASHSNRHRTSSSFLRAAILSHF